MGRNTEKNAKIHNDKLHKKQDKVKLAAANRKIRLREIAQNFNAQKSKDSI